MVPIWKLLRLSLFLTRSNILAAMEYRVSFITQVIGMVVNDAAFTVLWYIYFTRFPSVNGWSWHDTALLIAITTLNFSFVFIFCRGAFDLSRTIRHGELDYYLAFPKDVLWHVSFSRTEIDAIGDLIFGIGMFVLFTPVTLERTLLFLAVSSLSAVVMYSFIVLTQTLAFFVSNFEEAARDVFELLLGFSFYPQNVFGGAIRAVMIFVVPAFFTATLPHHVVQHFRWQSLGLLALVSISLLGVSVLFFRFGLKRYESGNLVGQRI